LTTLLLVQLNSAGDMTWLLSLGRLRLKGAGFCRY